MNAEDKRKKKSIKMTDIPFFSPNSPLGILKKESRNFWLCWAVNNPLNTNRRRSAETCLQYTYSVHKYSKTIFFLTTIKLSVSQFLGFYVSKMHRFAKLTNEVLCFFRDMARFADTKVSSWVHQMTFACQILHLFIFLSVWGLHLALSAQVL